MNVKRVFASKNDHLSIACLADAVWRFRTASSVAPFFGGAVPQYLWTVRGSSANRPLFVEASPLLGRSL